jgi:hypothetical protein
MMKNDELEKTWKEMIVTCLKTVVLLFLEGLPETTEMKKSDPEPKF